MPRARKSSIAARTWSGPPSAPVSARSEKNTSWATLSARKILANHRHHRVDRARRGPAAAIGLRRVAQGARRIRAASACADRNEIVAGIEPLGDRPDLVAKRLEIAQIGGAGEHVDLRAGVVDVIFARHLSPGEAEQARQSVAEHRAARVADMHRAGRVGADIFDIDRARRRPRRPRQRRDPSFNTVAQNIGVNVRLQTDIDKAGPGDFAPARRRHIRRGRRRSRRRARARSNRRPWPPWRRPSRRWSRGRHALASRGGSTTKRARSSVSGRAPASTIPVSRAATRCWKSTKIFIKSALSRSAPL